jgi:hypothetical protein
MFALEQPSVIMNLRKQKNAAMRDCYQARVVSVAKVINQL